MKKIINQPTKGQMFIALVIYLLFNSLIGDIAINIPTNAYFQLGAVIIWFILTFILVKMAYNLITKTVDNLTDNNN